MDNKNRKLLVLAIILAAVTMRAPISTVGPLAGLIRADLSLSAAAAGMLTTIPLLLFALFSFITGRFLSQLRSSSLIICCLCCVVAGSLIRSWCGLAGLYCGIVLLGAGIGIMNVLLPPLIRKNFADNIGIIMGIYNSSLNLFSGLGSGLSSVLAVALGGWRTAAAFWGLAALVAIPVWAFCGRSSIETGHENEGTKVYSLDRKAWLIAACMGLQALIYFSIIAWLPTILKTKTDLAQAPGMLILWLQLLSIITGFLTPVLTQRNDLRRFISIAGGGSYFVGLSLILIGKSLPLLIIGCGFCGLASGICFSYVLTLISKYGSTNEITTWVSGFAQMIGYLLASIGPLLLGFVYDLSANWIIPLLILICISVFMAVTGIYAGKNVSD